MCGRDRRHNSRPSFFSPHPDDCGCSLLYVKMKQVIPGYESENLGQGESLPGPIPLGGRGISTELFQTIDKISPPRSIAVVQCDVDEGNIEPPLGTWVISPVSTTARSFFMKIRLPSSVGDRSDQRSK